ncbi:SusC/RagA family TonB-linked outer membrane protein [Maribellus comscasis]|uniref:SusC/RagA family TonB-linked outer membrane protein n=2 Tax=Maribellus comscasis TaxID=2681766 RepID=A0A6I6JW91_9BACT|nr:SusC/RagA family TonB-linked outer membrane protein [Maribellus comscasis]
MKKKCMHPFLPCRRVKKLLLMMKLTAILILAGLMQVSATVYSQATKFNLRAENKQIVEVLKEIEESSNFRFFYIREQVDVERYVSLKAKNATVEEILDEIFAGQNIAYDVMQDNLILLSPEDKPIKLKSIALQQPNAVTGRVTDTSGRPLPGVTVVIKGTTQGTVTDADGKYTIPKVPDDAVLQFSFVGMSAQEIVVGNQTTIDITMLEETIGLEEVVAIGYGIQKKATLTGAINNVKGEEIVKAPTTNASQMLSGLLPGLTTIQRSGEPGNDDPIVRIRGINTLGDNSPLVVVDGVPGRSLSRIDPNSIESITVLKDASAAIYGSQAANGVILITTKRGEKGKPKITVNFNQGFNQPTVIPEMCDGSEYATLLNELDLYDGREPRYTDEQVQKFTSGSDPWLYPNTDWFDEVLKPWSAQNNLNAQLRGGSENVNYYLSVGSKFQDAFYKNSVSNYKQYDFRSNIDAKISEYIKIGADVYGRMENTTSPTRGYGTIFRTTTLGNPNIHAVWPDGSPGPDIIEGSNPVTISTNAAGYDNNKVYTINSSFKLDVTVPWVKGLTFTGSANLDKSFQNRKRWETPWEVNTWDGTTYENGIPVLNSAMVPFNDARLTRYMYDNQSLLLNGILNYSKSIDKHEINFMAGIESREGKGNNFNAYRRHFASIAIDELFAGGGEDQDNTGTSYENARLNYFGRVNYNYSEKLLFEFVWRYDGSYMFPEESRFGFFPGVSLGWRISEENFWKENLSFMEDFKLRVSYGQTGNDRIDEWQYLSSYSYSSYVYNFGTDEANKLLYEARIPNENVSWEVANQADIGFESYFMDHKLYFEFDYFDYRRSKILWWRNASVPSSTGLTLPRENIGKVTNRGADFTISYHDKIQDLAYNISFNGGYAKNKITFWDETPGSPEWQKSTGKPIPTNSDVSNDLYYEAIGIFKDQAAVDAYPHWEDARPGDIIFKDVNDDGKIDGLDRVRNDKNNIPRFTGALKASITYNQFDLSILFQGAAGAVRYISTESGQIGNFLKDFYDNRWTPDNTDASGPRAYNRDAEYWRSNRNTYFLKKSDYIRLKTLEIGYSLPASINSKLGIDGLRIYISGYNLWTFSPDIKDFDPESEQTSLSGQSQPYPAQRVINGGISLTF